MLKLRIDGRFYKVPVPPEMSLLQVIQEQLRTIGHRPPAQESNAPEL